MYLIVVGAGNIGTQLIDIATQSGNEVVVIERDRERAETAAVSSTVSSSTTTQLSKIRWSTLVSIKLMRLSQRQTEMRPI